MSYIAETAHVSGDAHVAGNAYVAGDAHVSGNAYVAGNADILVLGPSSSSGRYTTAYTDSLLGVRVNCGCFTGTIKEFETAIRKTHATSPRYLAEYLGYVACIKAKWGLNA